MDRVLRSYRHRIQPLSFQRVCRDGFEHPHAVSLRHSHKPGPFNHTHLPYRSRSISMRSLYPLVLISGARALGRFFTFEISIRDQHKLITTYPYSVVRHPSYTGVLGTFPGAILCLFGPGSWMLECGLLEILPVKVFATLFISGQLYVGYILLARMGKENKMMKKEFGKQWEEWANNVPYKLVPGVY
jgi:protein-S-isoprenylcysteine O-methyltransferase Ste14